jgi:hypothetical protein
VLQESLDHLKRNGFEIERTTTGYAFTLGPKSEVVDLYIDKEECDVIQDVGKILEIKILDGPKLRITVLHAVIGTG